MKTPVSTSVSRHACQEIIELVAQVASEYSLADLIKKSRETQTQSR